LNSCILMEAITKRFPGVTALNRVTVEFARGEIHALLGENGAGKTTLMNILYGLVRPDEGRIFIDGRQVSISSSHDAIANGIGMVHQHFMLIPKFTVLENIIVGTPSKQEPLLDLKSARAKIKTICRDTGLQVDLDSKVMDLSVGDQQRVEIIKALYKGARILIMDEPTAVLTPRETDELFSALSKWIKEGNTAIFITHKIKEVLEACDHITVLRDGECIGTVQAREADYTQIARLMVGRELAPVTNPGRGTPGKKVFEVRNLVVQSEDGVQRVNDVSFEIAEGEVLGIAGVDGNGQLELVESIVGLMPVRSGEILLEGKSIKGLRPDQILSLGVSNIPFKRQTEGLAVEFSIEENYILKERWHAPFSRRGLLQTKVIQQQTRAIIEEYHIKANGPETKVGNMSGGNQQKVVIAREFERKPKVLIACHPTHGLDVGAIEFIHRRLLEQKTRDTAILLISTELDELFNLSDRIIVLYKGEVMGETLPSAVEIEKIGLMMLGEKG
jgi:general nucleoside transport system ATP-binding protein